MSVLVNSDEVRKVLVAMLLNRELSFDYIASEPGPMPGKHICIRRRRDLRFIGTNTVAIQQDGHLKLYHQNTCDYELMDTASFVLFRICHELGIDNPAVWEGAIAHAIILGPLGLAAAKQWAIEQNIRPQNPVA